MLSLLYPIDVGWHKFQANDFWNVMRKALILSFVIYKNSISKGIVFFVFEDVFSNLSFNILFLRNNFLNLRNNFLSQRNNQRNNSPKYSIALTLARMPILIKGCLLYFFSLFIGLCFYVRIYLCFTIGITHSN